MRRSLLTALVAGLLALALTACGREPEAKRATTQAKPPPEEPGNFDLSTRPKAVDLGGAGAAPKPEGGEDGISPGAQSDDEVRREVKQADKELAQFSDHLDGASLTTGARARVLSDGTAVAPRNAPDVVKRVILAGNQIAKFPYKWGGGHGAWRDNGYDCSGSVSFALAGAGLLRAPMASGPFMRWGGRGSGPLDHDLREPRPHLHGRGGPALRHERPRPRGHPLAGRRAPGRRLRGAPPPALLMRRAVLLALLALAACGQDERPQPRPAAQKGDPLDEAYKPTEKTGPRAVQAVPPGAGGEPSTVARGAHPQRGQGAQAPAGGPARARGRRPPGAQAAQRSRRRADRPLGRPRAAGERRHRLALRPALGQVARGHGHGQPGGHAHPRGSRRAGW